MKKPRLAVSAIFKHQEQIYSIKRQNHLRAFPGYTSFPGGKVDKADNKTGEHSVTLQNALERELSEELQIDLSLLKEQGIIEEIRLVGKATSPKFNPYIYESYFYLITCAELPQFIEDDNEIFSSNWCTPAEVLCEYDAGKSLIIFPIRKMIEGLVNLGDRLDFIDFDEMRGESIPIIEPIKNFFQVMPDSNTLFPATKTNSFILGDSKKTLIDPSPKDMDTCIEFLKTISGFNFEYVFITHHHFDHHEYAPYIASQLKVPIKLSKDTYNRCRKKYGADYFKESKILFAKEGDVLTTWLGRDINIYEIPGHDEGHLGLAPTSMEWFIVGDLFQGVGTVVVGGEEGDMTKYFASLNKVIKLAPKSVTPSHGITLGGVNILEKTLKHRELREEQILHLYQNGKSLEETLKTIYFDIPEKLYPYARASIQSHIDKLKTDKKIN